MKSVRIHDHIINLNGWNYECDQLSASFLAGIRLLRADSTYQSMIKLKLNSQMRLGFGTYNLIQIDQKIIDIDFQSSEIIESTFIGISEYQGTYANFLIGEDNFEIYNKESESDYKIIKYDEGVKELIIINIFGSPTQNLRIQDSPESKGKTRAKDDSENEQNDSDEEQTYFSNIEEDGKDEDTRNQQAQESETNTSEIKDETKPKSKESTPEGAEELNVVDEPTKSEQAGSSKNIRGQTTLGTRGQQAKSRARMSEERRRSTKVADSPNNSDEKSEDQLIFKAKSNKREEPTEEKTNLDIKDKTSQTPQAEIYDYLKPNSDQKDQRTNMSVKATQAWIQNLMIDGRKSADIKDEHINVAYLDFRNNRDEYFNMKGLSIAKIREIYAKLRQTNRRTADQFLIREFIRLHEEEENTEIIENGVHRCKQIVACPINVYFKGSENCQIDKERRKRLDDLKRNKNTFQIILRCVLEQQFHDQKS
jgi:hypothetical protein